MTLFEVLNAPPDASPATISIAVFFAEQLIVVVPLLLAGLWLWGDSAKKRAVVAATIAGLLALGIAQLLTLHYMPRPFMTGVGRTLIQHVPDSSFPSDHATLMAAVAASLVLVRETRAPGIALALLWLPLAWARVYVGVHFPSDVIGGAIVGCASSGLVALFAQPVVSRLTLIIERLYSKALAQLIARGWLK
jgi:undecaprenyl-diphosphatase